MAPGIITLLIKSLERYARDENRAALHFNKELSKERRGMLSKYDPTVRRDYIKISPADKVLLDILEKYGFKEVERNPNILRFTLTYPKDWFLGE